MRSVNGHSIFSLDQHIRRMTKFRSALPGASECKDFNEQETRHFVLPHLQHAMKAFLEKRSLDIDSGEEMKISLVFSLKRESMGKPVQELQLESDVDVGVSVGSLSVPQPGGVEVESALHHRSNPTVKHGDWVHERKQLEESMRPGSNEVIMVDDGGQVFEGLSSNFVVVEKDGTVVTAPSDVVLEGTVLKMLIGILDKHNVPLVRKHPILSEASQWQGALVTSTSRLALPVDKLWMTDKKTCVQMQPEAPVVKQIQQWVKQQVESQSEKVI